MTLPIPPFWVPLCAFTLVAAAGAPAVQKTPAAVVAPGGASAPAPAPAPPNGTYTFVISRNGTDRGKTTVVIFRRDEARAIETDEAGIAAAASAHIVAAYRDTDLSLATYLATYQAPFPAASQLGRARAATTNDASIQQTVRYRGEDDATYASIDGRSGVQSYPRKFGGKRSARERVVLDGPFMTGYLMLAAQRHRLQETAVWPVSVAFPIAAASAPQRLIRATAQSPKTPKSDVALDVPGVARVWFDPRSYVVHEVHVEPLNIDARLVAYTKAALPAPFESEPSPAATPRVPQTSVTFPSADGTLLAGALALPATTKSPAPAVVFVPPGSQTQSESDATGAMYRDLASALAARGYATLRYDARGAGSNARSSHAQTWDASVNDTEAAIRFASGANGVDPKRVYALGYGSGADLALAASAAAPESVGGVVALAPTVGSYRDCAQRRSTTSDGAWEKTALAHDPAVLARRSTAPILALHPGSDPCGASQDALDSYDEKLRAANPRATVIAAKDLSERFGGAYDADSPQNSEALFPYRFDVSTVEAIGDWFGSAKAAAPAASRRTEPQASGTPKPPPAPPSIDKAHDAMPSVHASPLPSPTDEPLPGQVTVPGPPLPGSPPPSASPAPQTT